MGESNPLHLIGNTMPTYSQEEYDTARATAEKGKHKEGFLLIKFNYSTNLVLPYKAGVALMRQLEHAEQIEGNYKKEKIVAINSESVETRVLSHEEYITYKMAAILGVTYDELVAGTRQAALLT